MAQVADPQDTSASNPESLGSADEMLSQLAGSEIDRLLAEADVESPQPKSQSCASGARRDQIRAFRFRFTRSRGYRK